MAEILNEEKLDEVNGGYSGPCFIYVIKSGDCLSKIAEKYGTTVATLSEINNITDVDKIYAGDQLLVPLKVE